jgi:hypothetical protein
MNLHGVQFFHETYVNLMYTESESSSSCSYPASTSSCFPCQVLGEDEQGLIRGEGDGELEIPVEFRWLHPRS